MEGGGEYSQYKLSDPPNPFPQRQDDGGSAAHVVAFCDDDKLLELYNSLILAGALDLPDLSKLRDGDLSGTKQLDAGSSGVNHVRADADPWRMCDPHRPIPAAGTGVYDCGDASLEQSSVGDYQPSPTAHSDSTIQVGVGFDSVEPSTSDTLTTTEPDDAMEFAAMVRVAAQCGKDDERTQWSEEEHKELLARLDLYAAEDAVARCFKIAYHLPRKTALDVALRCRWLQVKGSNIAKSSNKMYPLSKEALSSKSNKELIEDNDMFLKRIEENLKIGQLADAVEYFYYVKTNMDAIKERGSEFGVRITMPPIDEQALEEILRTRPN